MKPTRRKIVFVEQFYYPDGWGGTQLPIDITTHLARNGWDVTVLCGSDPYAPVAGDPGPDPTSAGVRIWRIPRLFAGDIHRRKLLRQLWFYIGSVLPLLFSQARLYITQTNPPLVVFIVAVLAMLRRKPFVIVAQDLYPEVMVSHGMLYDDGWLTRTLSAVFSWSYRKAAAVVSLGPRMTQRLVAKGVARERIFEISNWSTGEARVVRGDENRLRASWGLSQRFVALYSGNLGIGHDVETLLLALRRVLNFEPKVMIVFIGKGFRLEEAKRLTRELGLEEAVQFRDFVPNDMLPQTLGLADVALVTLRREFEGVIVPSKLLGYMARGIPTIYVGPDSDVEYYLTASGGGLVFRNDDVTGLSEAILAVVHNRSILDSLGTSARLYYSNNLDRAIGLDKYSTLIAGILGERP